MPTQILMPALSPTMEEGKLVKWHIGEGDAVRAGDVIAEIETDKATMEVEAVDEGRMGKLLVPEGTEHVKVNQPIALLYTDGEDTSRPSSPDQVRGKLSRQGLRQLLRMRIYLLTLRKAHQRPSRRVRPRQAKRSNQTSRPILARSRRSSRRRRPALASRRQSRRLKPRFRPAPRWSP